MSDSCYSVRLFTTLFLVSCSQRIISAQNIDFVRVDVPVNPADSELMSDGTLGYGAVGYIFEIGKHEVTNSQYAAMLNAVAASDANGLFNTQMETNPWGGIIRIGNPGQYSYEAKLGRENHPVSYVSLLDSLRFANWLNNGQPTGPQSAATTEDGAYALGAGNTSESVERKPGARYFLASENEWYKAAYYQPMTGYFDYATASNVKPNSEPPPGGQNSANYRDSMLPGPTGSGYALTGSHMVDFNVVYFTNVGAYSDSASPFGTFDQGGNVWEMTEGLLGNSFYGLRGGSWNDAAGSLPSSIRGIWQDFRESFSVGFRISRLPVPEPATCILLLSAACFVRIRMGRQNQAVRLRSAYR